MPKTELPAMASELPQMRSRFGSLEGRANSPDPADTPASPSEGAELIRAFLSIEQRDVRAAIIELVTNLSSHNSRTG